MNRLRILTLISVSIVFATSLIPRAAHTAALAVPLHSTYQLAIYTSVSVVGYSFGGTTYPTPESVSGQVQLNVIEPLAVQEEVVLDWVEWSPEGPVFAPITVGGNIGLYDTPITFDLLNLRYTSTQHTLFPTANVPRQIAINDLSGLATGTLKVGATVVPITFGQGQYCSTQCFSANVPVLNPDGVRFDALPGGYTIQLGTVAGSFTVDGANFVVTARMDARQFAFGVPEPWTANLVAIPLVLLLASRMRRPLRLQRRIMGVGSTTTAPA